MRSSLLAIGMGLFIQIAVSLSGNAQGFRNEWINYALTYQKFKIGQSGLYRITQSSLTAMGWGQVPAEQFVLWRNGQQVPLFTSVAAGPLPASGFIEFWGEANDGKADQSLFRVADHQLNDTWSLFTDSASFFLTVDPSATPQRLVSQPNSIPAGLTPVPYFIFRTGIAYRERLNEGLAQLAGSYLYSSAFDQGEGWTSGDLAGGQTRTETFSNLFSFNEAGAPVPRLVVHAAGNAPNNRTVEIRAGGSQVQSQALIQFGYAKWNISLASDALSSGSLPVAISNLQTVGTDRMVLAKIELQYARRFHFGGADRFLFYLPASPTTQYLEIDGVNHGGVAPILYDLSNGQRYQTLLDAQGQVRVLLQPATVERKLLLISPTAAQQVNSFAQRQFIDYTQPLQQGDYLIISHRALERTAAGVSVLDAYKQFRSSAAGGTYKANIYFIDQLEDQFAYGIKKHPESIRNFIRFAHARFSAPVRSVFLIGKGVTYPLDRALESNPDLDKLSFIPTFGAPASDVLLTVEPGLSLQPRVAIGRLSVINAEEIAIYLAKVMQTESVLNNSSLPAAQREWTKNVVHIVGVGDEALGNIITSSMNRFATILRDTLYGATVHDFSKLSPAPVAQLSATRMYELFEQGIGMMTYFGHSTANTLEYNLDEPQGYNNQGKYPFYIMLGCRAGNLFNFNTTRLIEKETISEKFILADQRGGIATIASTSLGLVSYLELQNEEMLKAAAKTRYGATVGDIINESLVRTMSVAGAGDFFARIHCEQTALNGDPALRFYGSAPRPDYVVEERDLKVSPALVSVADGSFSLSVRLRNSAKAIPGPVVVQLQRSFPDGTSAVVKRDTLSRLYATDSLIYRLPIVANRDKGLTRLTVCIDPENRYTELLENNNCAAVSFYIIDEELRPVLPAPYSIVGANSIVFSASTANPFSPSRTYQVEIDTTTFFNSGLLFRQTIQSSGGVIRFSPSLSYRNNTVYYWRAAPQGSGGVPNWNQSSFLFMPNQPSGYNQSHFYQHLASRLIDVRLDSASRSWRYTTNSNHLNIRNGVFFTATSALAGFYLGLNGLDLVMYACARNRLVFTVLDPVTLRPIINALPGNPGRFGSDAVCVQTAQQAVGAEYNFQFNVQDTAARRNVVNFLDSIPDGHYVVVRNIMETNYPANAYAPDWKNDQLWLGSGNSIYHRLKDQGFSAIDSFNRNRVFAFIYKKNQAQVFSPRFAFSAGIYDQLFFSTDITTTDTLAKIESPLLGSARGWQQLQWQGTAESSGADSVLLDVYGVNNAGQRTLLLQGIRPSQTTVSLSTVEATRFPYLQLSLSSQDMRHYTPYQLTHWRILHQPVPEGALAPHLFLSVKDTVEQGEPYDYKVAFVNVSESAFDSISLRITVTDAENLTRVIPLLKTKPLPPADTVRVGARLNTTALAGSNTIFLEVNPNNDQPEQHHFNNVAYRSFYVRPDRVPPLLDVIFDGKRIANRDTVLPNPDIQISLRDESKWMLLNDTSLLSVWLRYPAGQLRRIYYNAGDTLLFFAATDAISNKATAQFRPTLAPGLYELVVAAKDKAGNRAGQFDYRISFVVSPPRYPVQIRCYPNPFSVATSFAVTLLGNSLPMDLRLQIYSANGQLVREVPTALLGPLRLGYNQLSFQWDGRGQRGQRLASGAYMCRLVAASMSGDSHPYEKKGGLYLIGQGQVVLLPN
ncbi:MAG: hypothetical protein FJ340_07705 [Sphingomonadales bacterium]|nr:hypothetical protein [Sphingomonadales bacterium]